MDDIANVHMCILQEKKACNYTYIFLNSAVSVFEDQIRPFSLRFTTRGDSRHLKIIYWTRSTEEKSFTILTATLPLPLPLSLSLLVSLSLFYLLPRSLFLHGYTAEAHMKEGKESPA